MFKYGIYKLLELRMAPIEMIYKLWWMKLSVYVQGRQRMRSKVLLWVHLRRRHVRFHCGGDWWVQIVIAIDKVLLLLLNVRRCHDVFHHNNFLRQKIVGNFLRLIAQRLTYIHSSQLALIVDVKVEVCRKFKLIW